MAHFYSNENFPLPVAEALRKLGHDVLTVQESGKADQALPDKEVLDFAIQEGRTVLTLNRLHFMRLHQLHPKHRGIVVCKLDLDFQRQADRIHEVVSRYRSLDRQLIRINRE